MKKPSKSYDLKGFNSICISTGGERGICLFLKSGVKQGIAKLFVLSDTSTDTSLF
jgi:hypothetical protein